MNSVGPHLGGISSSQHREHSSNRGRDTPHHAPQTASEYLRHTFQVTPLKLLQVFQQSLLAAFMEGPDEMAAVPLSHPTLRGAGASNPTRYQSLAQDTMENRPLQGSRRSRRSDLRPLMTGITPVQRTFDSVAYREAASASSVSPNSSISPASPMAAVRQYYWDHGLTTVSQPALAVVDSRTHRSQVPRRHSILSPSGLISRVNNVYVSSPGIVQRGRSFKQRQSIAGQSRDMLLNGLQRSELARLGSVALQKKSLTSSGVQPSIYDTFMPDQTHERLREWGRAYLGNAATADVFVKAVHVHTLEQAPGPSTEDKAEKQLEPDKSRSTGTSNEWKDIIVRARVFPRAKERKPFLIQRHFYPEEMRASLPRNEITIGNGTPPVVERETAGQTHTTHIQLRPGRSYSTSSVKASVIAANLSARSSSEPRSPVERLGPVGRRIMPIHVQYALNYLPVLAALMFSGHIRKGDAIDLPLPHPNAWGAVVAYVYTGEGEVTSAMRENILYLAGRVD